MVVLKRVVIKGENLALPRSLLPAWLCDPLPLHIPIIYPGAFSRVCAMLFGLFSSTIMTKINLFMKLSASCISLK
jgi:hypothetical protein